MARQPATDLIYGHLGQPTYNIENKTWTFLRRPDRHNWLRQLGTWKTVIPPSVKLNDAAPPKTTRNPRSALQAAKALTRGNADLVPSMDIIADSSLVSAAITSIANSYDPSLGSRMSFGWLVADTDRRRKRSAKQVAAIVAGEGRNLIHLLVPAKQKYGWGIDRGTWIGGYTLTPEESGYWAGDATPIKQLCFAQTETRHSFLAARYATKTVFFRPSRHEARQTPERSQYYDLPPSRIDANPIFCVPCEQSGNFPHVDVSFNPDYERQFGLVDQQGNWSIWDIEGGERSDSQYSTNCTTRGTIHRSDDNLDDHDEQESPLLREDGWARILWVGTVNTVLVCNRKHLNLFDIRGDKPTLLKNPELINKNSADWILDVRKHPADKHQVFLLTSTRLYLLAVAGLDESNIVGNMQPETRVILSWTHFRDAEDFTLQLCVPTLPHEDTVAIIHSQISGLMTIHQFQEEEIDPSLSLSSADPSSLHIDRIALAHCTDARYIYDIQVLPLKYMGADTSEKDGLGATYASADIRFYRLVIMFSDLSIEEIFLHSTPSASSLAVDPPSWTLTTGTRMGVVNPESTIGDDDFIVPDGFETTTIPQIARCSRFVPLDRSGPNRKPLSRLDFGLIYIKLFQVGSHLDGSSGLARQEVNTLIEKIEQLLQDRENEDNVARNTMFDHAESNLAIADIEAASTQLQRVYESADRSKSLQLHHVTPGRLATVPHSEEEVPDILSTYHTLLEYWIASLPLDMSRRVRRSKELLARRIAAEVVLSSIHISPRETLELLEATSNSPATAALDDAPPHYLQHGALEPSSSQYQSQEPDSSLPVQFHLQTSLPTPEPTPSVTSATTYTSTLASGSTPIGQLGKYLLIEKPPAPIPDSVNEVLMQWRLGSDPKAYDWEATNRALEETSEDEVEDQAKKEKLRRRTERFLKRQRREAEIRQMTESQPALAFRPGFRSSPPRAVGMGLSSQTQGLSQSQGSSYNSFPIVNSQVEPGRHGGRPVKKKAKRMVGLRRGSGSDRTQLIFDLTSDSQASRIASYIMSGFPTLQPAFTVRVGIDAPLSVGGQQGPGLVIVPMVSGTVKSEPGFSPALDATLQLMARRHGVGYDYIHNDVDGANMRLDVRSQVKNSDGTLFAMYYKGTVVLTDGLKAILGGDASAKTTDYGDSFVNFTFETGSKEYKDLENGTFVAAGHFVVEDKAIIVEYKVSKVVIG
ncbi:hypothetical protein EJ04DRAFT_463543 [Polyplosphaeria fusca]|uniref:Uncharacterized protein n=1 Tax=Polyplosphaeria fusca TaxID=682080 RepID=A0A9P4R460_9PLEO|nr:hypothetical protein EJ04DRAFT_463543 [Polyplosphaeria fusca]